MAALETGIIVAIALGSLLVVLLLLFSLTSLCVMRRKKVFCFKRRGSEVKPFLLSDRELEKRHGAWKRKDAQRKRLKDKKKNYHSLSRPPKFPKRDPFVGKFLENPMVTTEDLDVDWSNPAFDMQAAVQRDAVITIQSWYRMVRERIPYMQLRESTLLVQALYRGRQSRRLLPKYRREKAARDQLRKKQPGWKKQGTLSGLKYYDVKAFGFAEVEQLYGLETVRDATRKLKGLYSGKGKIRLKLFISVKGVKLYNYTTMEHFATVKVATISFCTLDPKNRKIFSFINRKRRRNYCHVFQAAESDAQKMVETMAQAFEVTFRQLENKKEQQEKSRDMRIKQDAFERKSRELDDEVQSMLEMAETASSVKLDRIADFESEDDESRWNSRENLLENSPLLSAKKNRQSMPSGLLASHKAPVRRELERQQSEETPEDDGDENVAVTTDVMNYTGLTLDKESRRARILTEQNWDIDIPSD